MNIIIAILAIIASFFGLVVETVDGSAVLQSIVALGTIVIGIVVVKGIFMKRRTETMKKLLMILLAIIAVCGLVPEVSGIAPLTYWRSDVYRSKGLRKHIIKYFILYLYWKLDKLLY